MLMASLEEKGAGGPREIFRRFFFVGVLLIGPADFLFPCIQVKCHWQPQSVMDSILFSTPVWLR